MIVGTCRVSLHIPDSGSLKAKRFALRSLKDRVRNKFNVSVAEVDDFDLWQRATIGIAVVANEGRFADKVISSVVGMIESDRNVVVIDIETDLR
ncbi:MAG: DUF503 domain-containing protein [Candidatus Eisenbacteria bacterium]